MSKGTQLRRPLLCLVMAWLGLGTAVAQEASPLGMSYVQTKDLQLIYFDSLDYLAPHAVRTFTNSHAWQRRMFGWVPSQRTGVLLKDFADYGNGAAWEIGRAHV